MDLGPLNKGFHSAAEETIKFRETVMHAAEAIGVFEAARGLKEYVTSTIEAVGQTKILAERVGFSVEGFQKLAYAAKFAHVDQDTLATSLGQLSKRLGEVAIEGSGPAADALKRFGLSAQTLAAMGPEKAFGVLLGVMEKISNPMERSAVAMDLFGKSGQGMINLVAQGGAGIKGMGDEASRLGIALSAVDVAKTVEAEEAMIRLSAASQGFANLVVTQLSPYITLVIDKYMEWGYSGTKSASFITQGMEWVVSGIGLVIDTVNVLKAGFWGLLAAGDLVASGMVTSFQLVGMTIDRISVALGQSSLGLGDFFQSFNAQIQKNMADHINLSKEAIEKVGQGKKVIRDLVDDVQGAAQARAEKAAKKGAGFIAPGAIGAKPDEQKFASAIEMGSKEAYSAILDSRSQQRNLDQDIADNTKAAADTANQSLAVLKAMNDQLMRGLLPGLPGALGQI